MAARAFSLLEVLASKGGLITKTTVAPSSCAAVNIWRKYFDTEEQEEEENNNVVDQIAAMQEMEMEKVNPIDSPNVIKARNNFVLEYWRNMSRSQPPPPPPSSNVDQSLGTSLTERNVSTPDLRIPVGEGLFLNIAQ